MKKCLYIFAVLMCLSPFTASAQTDSILLKRSEPVTSHDEEKVNWKTCQHDTDCVIIGEDCAVDAVNEEFESEAEKELEAKNKDVECKIDEDTTGEPSSICSNAVCTVRY